MEMENKPKKSNKKLWLGIIAIIVVVGVASVQSSDMFQGMLTLPGSVQDKFKDVPKDGEFKLPKFTKKEFKESNCDLYIGTRIKYELDGKIFWRATNSNSYYKNHNKLKIEDLLGDCQLKDFRFQNGIEVPDGLEISSATGQLTYSEPSLGDREYVPWTIEQGVTKRERSNMVYQELGDETYNIKVLATDGGGVHHAVLPVEVTLAKLPQSPRDGQNPDATDDNGYGGVSSFGFVQNNEYFTTSNPLEVGEGYIMNPRVPLVPVPGLGVYSNSHIGYPNVNVADAEIGSKFGVFPLLPTALAVDNNDGAIYNQIAPNLNEPGCREHLVFRVTEGLWAGDGFVNDSKSRKATDVVQQYTFTVCFE